MQVDPKCEKDYCNSKVLMSKLRLFLLIILLAFTITSYALDDLDSIKGDCVIIHYKPSQVKLAKYLTELMDSQITHFQKKLGVYPDQPVKVILAPSEKWYQEQTKGRKEIIKKAAAYYDGAHKTIIIRDPGSSRGFSALRTVFMHEYIHYFIDSYIAQPPLWFHEGMAVFFSGGYGINYDILFASGYLYGQRPTLLNMRTGYPASQNKWEMFYAVSALAMKTLYRDFKPEFYRFWYYAEQAGQKGGKVQFDKLFKHSFYMNVAQFDKYFKTEQKRLFKGQIFAVGMSFFGPLMALVLVLAFIKKKRLNKTIAEQWTDEKEIDDQSIETGDKILEGSGSEESTSAK